MKAKIIALGLAATVCGAFGASAQTVIEEHTSPPPVVIEHDHPDAAVTVEKHGGILGTKKKTIETTGSGDCTTKTVHKENLAGSTTTKKTDCD
jgi:hypothetical protein